MKSLSQLERLLFHQGGKCFFCGMPISKENASVEHLCAVSNGGRNGEDNCVVCCKALNMVLGNKSVREKFQVVLNQRGKFKCPATFESKELGAAVSNAEIAKEDLYDVAVASLQSIEEKLRPKTLKALTNRVRTSSRLEAKQAEELVARMQTAGALILEGTKVRYRL